MTNYFFGFSIGPIYDVIKSSRKTRELWFGSYFFSWMMNEIYTRLKEKQYDIIIPFLDVEKLINKQAGLIPDHIIGKSGEKEVDKIKLDFEEVKKEVIKFFAAAISEVSGKEEDLITGILKNYLQIDYVILPSEDENENPVEKIHSYISMLERNRSYSLGKQVKTCHRCKTLPSLVEHVKIRYEEKRQDLCPVCLFKIKCNTSEKVLTRLNVNTNNFRYPSVIEISAREIVNNIEGWEKIVRESEKQDQEIDIPFIKNIIDDKENKILRKHHCYAAIILADGDSLGQMVTKVENPEKVSENLFNYSLRAEELIKNYGGEPIYLGGDDLLAFTPVVYNGKSVFDLAKELNKIYYDIVNKEINGVNEATLSVGVYIFYYKSPLSTALGQAAVQLFDVAKDQEGKNSLALVYAQHAGHTTPIVINFNSQLINEFSASVRNLTSDTIKISKAMHHKLEEYKSLFMCLKDNIELENFFANLFNEKVHEATKVNEGIKQVRKLIDTSFKKETALYTVEKREEEFNNVLRLLKFSQLITGVSNE